MGWFILAHLFAALLGFIGLGRRPENDKDLEILILRHQLNIVARKQNKPLKPNRTEKLILAVLVHKLKQHTHRSTQQLREIVRIFKPETVLKWHRELVRRKWTYQRKHKGGRPRINSELENLIVRLAKENPRWGYGKTGGRAPQVGFQGLPDDHSKYSQPASDHPSASAPWLPGLAPTHESLSGATAGLRFLYRGDHLVADSLRPLLHRTGLPASSSSRGHRSSRSDLGNTTSPAADLGIGA